MEPTIILRKFQRRLSLRHTFASVESVVAIGSFSWLLAGVNYEEAPIHYRTTPPSNTMTRLQAQIDKGEFQLEFDNRLGYLPSLLKALDVSPTSQVMPFAKISRQNPKISPETPRAIYFNDDVHIGYVQDGLIEIAVTDPKLGMVFYTLDQSPSGRPVFENESSSCLTCHGTARTRNVPGLQVRSVVPDLKGEPVVAAGSFRSDHSSPLEKRWGGWYVTGKHGTEKHLGNLKLPDSRKPKSLDNPLGQNVTDLSSYFDTKKYLTPHSDIVALMVLEHQADALNYITTANFETRHALFIQEQQLQESEANAERIHIATQAKIAKAGAPLLKYLLFEDERMLQYSLTGTSGFTEEFPKQGPFDSNGRSLRQFDLKNRIFKYPLSYTIYSKAFDALPDEMKQYIYRELSLRLDPITGDSTTPRLDAETRQAILEILRATKSEFEKFFLQKQIRSGE